MDKYLPIDLTTTESIMMQDNSNESAWISAQIAFHIVIYTSAQAEPTDAIADYLWSPHELRAIFFSPKPKRVR